MMYFSCSSPYDYGIVTVKKFGDSFKITYHNVKRKSGWVSQVDSENFKPNDDISFSSDFSKLSNNISRAKNTIFELAKCNQWDFFVTLTVDKTKIDRFDLKNYRQSFTRFIRHLREKYHSDIKYLIIPEKHKNGAWHFHGLLSGIPSSDLHLFDLSEKLPSYIRQKIMLGDDIYNWVSYSEKFGFCDIERINDIDRICSYITKYITKSLANSVSGYYENMYYCSQGLNRSEKIGEFYPYDDIQSFLPWSYENEYCKILWVHDLPKKILDRLT